MVWGERTNALHVDRWRPLPTTGGNLEIRPLWKRCGSYAGARNHGFLPCVINLTNLRLFSCERPRRCSKITHLIQFFYFSDWFHKLELSINNPLMADNKDQSLAVRTVRLMRLLGPGQVFCRAHARAFHSHACCLQAEVPGQFRAKVFGLLEKTRRWKNKHKDNQNPHRASNTGPSDTAGIENRKMDA